MCFSVLNTEIVYSSSILLATLFFVFGLLIRVHLCF